MAGLCTQVESLLMNREYTVGKKRKYEENVVHYGDTTEYFAGTNDQPSWKIHFYTVISQGYPDKLVIDRRGFLKSRLDLLKQGIITSSQYSYTNFVAYLGMLQKLRIIQTLPSQVDDRFIKVVDASKDVITQTILKKINPEEKFRQDRLKERGKQINKELRSNGN